MSKFKDFIFEAEEELFEEANESLDECPDSCNYLLRRRGTFECPPEWICNCENETDCPHVTEEKVMARAQDKLEAFVEQAEQEAEDEAD